MRPLPILTLTLAMLLWSSSFIALKHVLEVWSFGQVLFMRMAVASGCWLLCYRHLGNFHYQKGYGIENTSTIHTVRVSLKVLEGNQGGSLYADMVTATKSYMAGPSLTIVTSDLINSLLDEAAQQISLRVADKVQTIRDMKVKSVPVVSVTIASDPQGVTVELDGAVLGSTPGTFAVPPGLHQLRLTQQWLNTWERTVNVTPNQSLSIKMELSDAGLARFKTLERFKHVSERNLGLSDS